MTVDFANKQETVSEVAEPNKREDLSLVYESDKVPFQLYSFKATRSSDKSILINFIYYLNDAPFQTPAPNPTQSPIPNSANDFIDKNFINTIPSGQILVQSGSNVKQISGCHFININIDGKNYFIRPETEVQIFNNIFEYRDLVNTYSSPIYANYDGSLTIRNCEFINARCSKVIGGDANVLSVDSKLNTIFDSCQFRNCGTNEDNQLIIRQSNKQGSLQLIDCTFTFDDVTNSCKVFQLSSSDVIINRCTFIKCGKDSRTISLDDDFSSGAFRFTNNVVKNVNSQFMLINNLNSKPRISGNIFQDITMKSGYLITINHRLDEILLQNNTFSAITSGNSPTFGGALSSWFARRHQYSYSIVYEKCKFINLSNANTDFPYSQGGAIQYGYSFSISNVSLTFQECEFRGNRCQNGKGGALAVNINNDLIISDCIFEDNQASQEGGCIYIYGKMVDMNSQNGAVKDSEMESITITNCQFINNKGTGDDSSAIYISKDYIGEAKLDITGCTFTNNGEDKSKYMIYSSCVEVNFESNKVEYLDESKTSGSIYFYNLKRVLVNNCNFIKCITATTSTLGLDEQWTSYESVIISNSEFLDCRCNNGGYTIFIPNCLSEFDNVTISFDSTSKSNGAINFGNKGFSFRNSKIIRAKRNDGGGIKFSQSSGNNDPVTISNCIFDECGNSNRLSFQLTIQSATPFTFENNVIQNMKGQGIANYIGLIDLNNPTSTLTIVNLTLINNSCNSAYGGGTGLWIQNAGKIIFDRCNFINNVVLKSESSRGQKPTNKNYFTGDGGGIQYGFTSSIYNIELQFSGCLFRENKAVRHGGAIAVQMNNNVVIENCIFESNVANYQPSSSKLLYENYFDLKTEGRGGAIYINPTFTYTFNGQTISGKTPSVRIEGCTFRTNQAYDGYAIYIEGEDDGTEFIINKNTFIDNYDPNSYSLNNSIITSEIHDLYEGKILTSNNFSFTDPNVYVPELLYVDHYGHPPTPSSTPVKTGANISDSSSLNNLNNLGFDCPLDRGSVKIYLTCSSCSIKENLYFTVAFDNQEITKVTYDPRLIYPATNPTSSLNSFVLTEKIVINKNNNSLSFDTGSADIKYSRIDNNLKCYVPPIDVVFKDGDCTPSKRCDKVIDEPRPVHVFVEVSQFNNFNQSSENGGAIHLIDCCLTCTDTPFTNCASNEGGGGAIYIKNELDYTNNITLVDLTFQNCQAKYGGAVYIYSDSFRVNVLVSHCTFNANRLIDNNDPELTGGSAIFLNTRTGNLLDCEFVNNYGSDSVSKIVTSFKSKKKSLRILSKDKLEPSVIVSNCKFTANTDSKSLIHFIRNSVSNVEVRNCIFTGVLKDGAHYIDEQIIDSNSPILKIKACKFSYDMKKSLNLDPKHDPSSIDLNDQVFNYSENNEQKNNSWKLIATITVPALTVVLILVVVAIIVHKKKNDNDDSNEQDNIGITDNSTQESNLA